jgi:hypothetical protein
VLLLLLVVAACPLVVGVAGVAAQHEGRQLVETLEVGVAVEVGAAVLGAPCPLLLVLQLTAQLLLLLLLRMVCLAEGCFLLQ